MPERQYEWEKDLTAPALVNGGSDNGWMELVETRVRSKKRGYAKIAPLAAGVLAVIVVLGLFVFNDGSFRRWIPAWNDPHQAAEIPLVEGSGIRIMPKEFLLFKEELNEPEQGNDAILQEMIVRRLTAQYAQTLGIVASPREVELAIEFQRDLLHRQDDPDNDAMRKLLAERIERSGLSEKEYWENDVIIRIHEERILFSKLLSKLLQDGTIKDRNDIVRLQKDLWLANKDKLTFNWSALWDTQ